MARSELLRDQDLSFIISANFCAMKYAEDSRPKRVFIKEHLLLNKGNKPDILALEKKPLPLWRDKHLLDSKFDLRGGA